MRKQAVFTLPSVVPFLLLVVPAVALGAGGAAPPTPAAAAAGPTRYTDATPDGMIAAAKARAMAPTATAHTGLGALASIAALADRANYGVASRAAHAIADSSKLPADVKGEAELVARSLAPDEGLASGIKSDRDLGLVTHLAIVGPFRDTGGGLARKEGSEKGTWGDPKGDYSWGTVSVRWRDLPESYAGADGVPLDVFVAPRKESCTYVATRLNQAGPFVVRVAATGSVRLIVDDQDAAQSDDVHESMMFDRLAAKVDGAGPHVVAVKVCSGALDDDGRVRIRLTDPAGAPIVAKDSTDPGTAGTSKVSRVQTPLEQTLAPGNVTLAGAGLDTRLDEIIVRTLGGADDMKSPRAPGLLDAFTHVAGLDADRYAMAGWVAPSGSNRSGWLHTARDLADKSGDAKAKAFAERRLVAQHLSARMVDWARAAATTALAGATDSEALLMDALVDQALGTDALKLRAYHHLAAWADAHPQDAPTSLLDELASLAGSYDQARALQTTEILARRGERGGDLVGAASARGKEDMARAAASAIAEAGIADADEAIDIVQSLGAAGAHDQALDLAFIVMRMAPNRAEAWSALADELTGATPDHAKSLASKLGAKNVDALVLGALERARELAPAEARYRAQMAMRTEKEDAGSRDDEKYMVASATLLARRKGVPPKPDVADRQLHWLRAVVMHPDRRVSQLIHYAREIVIAPRTQEELYENIPMEGDTTEILRARVHRKDGGTAYPLEENNDGMRPRIRWPELLPGDTVEVAVRSWTDHAVGGRGDPPYYFLDYAGSTSAHPILYNEVVVEATAQTPIWVDVLNAAPGSYTKEEKDANGRHVTRLVWTAPPSVAEEPLAPALSETVPVIAGSTFKNWTDFRTWYAEAVRGFTDPDDQVKRIAADLTKGKTTREAKLKAIFDFVADDIRYVNYVSGESWLPNRPQQLLARREGDCDDKALLLITLLRAVGIEAQEVLVQTRETGEPTVLLAKNVAIPMFDHGIAFLPGTGPNGGTYLDATSPQSRLGPLPSMDARAVALRMDAGPAEIVRLPNAAPEDHGTEVNWTITVKADGSGELVGSERHTGDGAFFLRNYLKEADARAQYVQDNLVGGWFPTVEVDKNVEFDGELALGAATVKYKAKSQGLARREQKDLVIPFSPSWTYTSALAPLLNRTLPVSLPPGLAPSHQTRTLRITAPAGYQFGELPPGGSVEGGEFGKASLEVTRDPKDPKTVIVKRSVSFDMHLVPIDKYTPWRAFLQKIDGLMHRSVRAVEVGGAP